MAIFKEDIVDIDLETGKIYRSFLSHTIGHKDTNADRFGVRVFRAGTAEDLTGVQCQAIFMAPDGQNIALTSHGTVSENVAYVTLPQACYNVEGQFCLAIKLVGGGITGTVRIVDGMVDRTGATGAVAPTEAVPTYQEILAVYAEMQEDIADYESVVANQNDQINSLKSAIINLATIPGDSKVLPGNFTNTNASGITYSTDDSTGEITVTNGSTSTYACLQTPNTWGAENLVAGKTYILHAIATKVSGSPNMQVAIRGTNGNADGIAKRVDLNAGENFISFVADQYMKRVTLFVAFGSSTKNSVSKFSGIWVKEYDTTGIDDDARELISDTIAGAIDSRHPVNINMYSGGVVTTTGKDASSSARARTGYIYVEPGETYYINIDTSAYKVTTIWSYSSANQNNGVRNLGQNISEKKLIFKAGPSENYIRIAFANASDDTQEITSSEYSTIISSILIYTPTDPTLTGNMTPVSTIAVRNSLVSVLGGNQNAGVPLYQYSSTRLATPIYVKAVAELVLADYWFKDEESYECILCGSNAMNYGVNANLTSWGDGRTAIKNAIASNSYNYYWLFIRNSQNTSASITPSEVIYWSSVKQYEATENPYSGKTFAVFCDSIGTHGNTGTWCNVPEITITADDVGIELNAYVTYYDLYTNINHNTGEGTFTGMTIGGLNLNSDSYIGQKITFTPTAEDVGKTLGKVFDWNGNKLDVWWKLLAEHYGMTPIPVCWASSSYSSHEDTTPRLTCAYAWHESQIRKAGIRTPGTMERTAPDYVILARGCNDMTHTPYDVLTDGYFEDFNFRNPQTDVISEGVYGFKEAIGATINKIWGAYPNTKIILCTLPYMKRVTSTYYPTRNTSSMWTQWNEAIKEAAQFYNCGILDLAKCGVNPVNLLEYAPDKTHPNAFGHSQMAKQAIKDMKLC